MYKVNFSTVLYKTPINQINNLIKSIDSLNKFCNDNFSEKIIFKLFIINNFSKNNNDEYKKLIRNKKFKIIYTSSHKNLGYGQGHNKNFESIKNYKKSWFIAVNPDISFTGKQIYKFITYIIKNENISCAAPLIYLPNREIQYSAKHNPTVLSLISSRFYLLTKIPYLKNHLYKNQNRNRNYKSEIIDCNFLSGCFLAFPAQTYSKIKGFNKKYFLHFEDADIVRRASLIGRTIHCPLGSIKHIRGRGSHNSKSQQFQLIKSYFFYSMKWGLKFK